jgi:signal transduction histidine kinase/DNA-binding response OmpR family regulator
VDDAEVLYLDPDAQRSGAIARWLRAEGVAVRTCTHLSEFLDALGEAVPQLLLVSGGPAAAELLHEVAPEGPSPVPVCLVGEGSEPDRVAGWLETVLDDAVGDPLKDPRAAAGLRAVLRRSAQLAALREDVDRTRFALRLAATWSEDEDFDGRIRGLAPALRRLPAVAGYQLALLGDGGGELDVVASHWPETGPSPWTAGDGARDQEAVGSCLDGGAPVAVRVDDVQHELLVAVTPGGAGLGVLRILLHEGTEPSDGDRAFYQALGRVLGANLAGWRSMQGLQVRQGRLESAFVARFQELRAANRRMEQLNRMKDDFVGVATHDLKGPLSVILGQGQLLDRGMLGPLTDKQAEAAAAILRQASRIRTTVDELRQRAQRGSEVEARRENVDLVQLVDRSMELALAQARRGAVSLTRQVDADELLHFGDPVQLRDSLVDLLKRAIASTVPGGEVLCALRQPSEGSRRIDLVIEGGAPPPDGESAARAVRGGDTTLTSCRQVAREHGGQLWIEQTPLGGRYTLSLPIPVDRSDPGRAGRARVVLVQPDPALAEAALRSLSPRFDVVRQSPARAGAQLAEGLPDALVVGVGAASAAESLALLDHIRGEEALAGIPLVVHTALPQEELVGHLAGARAWTAVAAPAAGQTLLRAVEAVLEGRRGPPLALPAFLDRLRRAIDAAPAVGHPVSVLRVRGARPLGDDRLARLAQWLEPRTRTADRLGLADERSLLLQLPGAPAWVPERIASDLVEAVGGEDADLLDPGDGLAWASWEPGDEIDGPEELLARLDDPDSRGACDVPAR